MANTLYITDLDGTLLSPRAALSPFAAQHLPRLLRGGLQFTVATARTWQSAGRLLKDILPLPVPAVLLNGALIYDTRTQDYVKKEIMPEERVRELLRVVKAHGQTGFLYSIKEGFIHPYHEDLSGRPLLQAFRDVRGFYTFTQVPDLAARAGEDIVYLTIQGAYDELLPLCGAIQTLPGLDCVLYGDSYAQGIWYLESFSHTASKYNAVRFLREQYGFGRVVGFGDNLNDIPLLRACDEGYAVANAREELKAIATGVIAPNAEDGVVKFLMAEQNTL